MLNPFASSNSAFLPSQRAFRSKSHVPPLPKSCLLSCSSLRLRNSGAMAGDGGGGRASGGVVGIGGKAKLKKSEGESAVSARGGRGGQGRSGASQKGSWPALKKRNLDALQYRHELRGMDLFTVPGFLSPKECESFIQCAEALGFQQQGSLGPKFGEAFRDNGRVSLNSPSLADKLWEAGISSLFQGVKVDGSRAVGLNPNLRFYRYVVGQQFGQHIDGSVDMGGGKATLYTMLVYLSGGEDSSSEKSSKDRLVGGETVFYDRRRVVAEVPPVAGMALFHIHGDQCMLHEAKVVSKGVKYVLRSDVVFD